MPGRFLPTSPVFVSLWTGNGNPSGRKTTVAKKTKEKEAADLERRDERKDRRGNDRRQQNLPVAKERRQDERRKVQRRRQIDPTTCERDYSPEEIEFMHALDAYKRASGRMFPTCSEILEVIHAMGYRRVAEPTPAKATPASSSEVDA